jgi:hypothetical protein
MSLTSYRAAPPRDKPLRTFESRAETNLANARGRRDQVRRLPEKATRARPLGASGMYQRRAALERPVGDLFRIYDGPNGQYLAQFADSSRSCQKVRERPALANKTAGTRR